MTTAETLWVPAANNHDGLREWAFAEISDPWDCVVGIKEAIR